MSDALKKVEGIRRLPIFPLPLVMVPNEITPLHIFEDRYRKMLEDVEGSGNRFGIVYFDAENEIADRPETGTVGCVAEIRQKEVLSDGRSNIVTTGVVRFRLLDYVNDDLPYFLGEVEFFEDIPDNSEKLKTLANGVFELFQRIANAAFKLSGGIGKAPDVQSAEPEALSFLIAAAFGLSNETKYKMLESTSTFDRLTELREVLATSVVQMESNAEIRTRSETNGHSKKKIDL